MSDDSPLTLAQEFLRTRLQPYRAGDCIAPEALATDLHAAAAAGEVQSREITLEVARRRVTAVAYRFEDGSAIAVRGEYRYLLESVHPSAPRLFVHRLTPGDDRRIERTA